ncbi:DHH family phosphoesterase [Candidatus Pacearchaeota archaeon]|nr:DHH family phosphoesterase [Candidatus Pacearchaeota archaeon]
MLSQASLDDLRSRLEGASCPAFLFDNDADGLCSFLIARRTLGKGIGIPVRSYPALDVGYCEQAVLQGADLLVVLDKPFLSPESVQFAKERSLPLIVLDHHAVTKPDFSVDFPLYIEYNPALLSGKARSAEPVSYLMYRALGRTEDLWLLITGCIADHYLPQEWNSFTTSFPALGGTVQGPFDAYYATRIGTLAQSLNFGLKDSLSHVRSLIRFLIECSDPAQVLSDNAPSSFQEKTAFLQVELERILGEREVRGKVLVVQYGGATSMSADVANKLSYLYPGMFVFVAYRKGGLTNISLRGKGVKLVFERIAQGFPGIMGGGHDDAIGGRITTSEVERFITALVEEVA